LPRVGVGGERARWSRRDCVDAVASRCGCGLSFAWWWGVWRWRCVWRVLGWLRRRPGRSNGPPTRPARGTASSPACRARRGRLAPPSDTSPTAPALECRWQSAGTVRAGRFSAPLLLPARGAAFCSACRVRRGGHALPSGASPTARVSRCRWRSAGTAPAGRSSGPLPRPERTVAVSATSAGCHVRRGRLAPRSGSLATARARPE